MNLNTSPSSSSLLTAPVCVGVIAGGHGVHGSVLIKAFTQDPKTLTTYKILSDEKALRSFKVKGAKIHKAPLIIARFEEISNREQAEELKGTLLYVDRSLFPVLEEEEYYHVDLIGLKVRLLDQQEIGTVQAVHNFGAGDILDICLLKGSKNILVPFSCHVVPEVYLSKGYMVIDQTAAVLDEKSGEEEA